MLEGSARRSPEDPENLARLAGWRTGVIHDTGLAGTIGSWNPWMMALGCGSGHVWKLWNRSWKASKVWKGA